MNPPVPPFTTSNHVDLVVDLDNEIDDGRRIAAEHWCLHEAGGRWFRSVKRLAGTVRFSFECDRDAIQFWLAN